MSLLTAGLALVLTLAGSALAQPADGGGAAAAPASAAALDLRAPDQQAADASGRGDDRPARRISRRP